MASLRERIGLILGPTLAVAAALIASACDLPQAAVIASAITVLTATWWISEAIPIPLASLIPLSALPLLGVLDHNQVAAAVGDDIVLLMLGGFLLSRAVEGSGLHHRIALSIVQRIGSGGPKRLVFGFMLASAVLSMWISNTATVLILLPVALAIVDQDKSNKLAIPLLLGTAYAASIGGMATPIGSPPNPIAIGSHAAFIANPDNAALVAQHQSYTLGFAGWMLRTMPLVVILLPIAWIILCRRLRECPPLCLPAVGPWQPAEKRILIIFGCIIAAWILRTAPGGGWREWLSLPGATDSDVALIGAVICALTPDGKGSRLLTWERALGIPWGLLLLFAGGLTIGRACDASGLSAAIGNGLASTENIPLVVIMLLLCVSVTFLTEFTSNTATASLLMPLLVALGPTRGLDPLVFMLPAALSASCAFMMPVATPPNAIVFGSERIPLRTMAREGLVLNLIAAGAITILGLILAAS